MEGSTGQLQYVPSPALIYNRVAPVSAELGRILAETGRIKFRASGTCMYPVIKPGDELHVDLKDISQIKVGDIAVFQRNAQLFSHRIIKKEMRNGKNYIITKSDTTIQGDDGPSYSEDIFGVVAHIKRSSKNVSIERRDYNIIQKIYFGLYVGLREGLKMDLAQLLNYIQQNTIYRKFARLWFEHQNPELSYSLLVPFNFWHKHGLYRRPTPSEFQVSDFLIPGDESKYFIFELFVNTRRRPAVSATFVFRPPGCFFTGWWIDNLTVRISHRGTGLEEKLLGEAKKVFGNSGVEELWVGPDIRLPGSIKWVRAFAF
jgi:signal peptidase I